MNKVAKFLLNNKILIAILLIIAIGLPTAIFKKAQGEETTIVVAVGIDKQNDKFSLSIQSANSLVNGTQTQAALATSGGETQKLEVLTECGGSSYAHPGARLAG